MKKQWLLELVCLLLLICTQAWAEVRTETVRVRMNHVASDEQCAGRIIQTKLQLEENETVRIDMSEVYAMYPEHTGIYGCLYASKDVTLQAGESTVTGKGVLEFAFPGTESCTVTGTGYVYAYFLPVQYKKLSTNGSMIGQSFDTSYLTKTAVGHYNMFMLADPKVYVYQEAIAPVNSVYKYHALLGPLPQQYRYMDMGENDGGTIFYSYVSERPVLIQCNAIRRDIYDTDSYNARKMSKASSGDGYEIWAYQGYQGDEGLYERVERVFKTSMKLAKDEFLISDLQFDPIVMVMLGEEIANAGAAGVAFNDETHSKIGFRSFVFVDAHSWEHYSPFFSYLFAHEIGHIIQARTLSRVGIYYQSWFEEGFASYFGEKVSALLGDYYKESRYISYDDTLALEKFEKDLVFGISDNDEYYPVADDPKVMLIPPNEYAFGNSFFHYLEEKYGVGFYKGISRSFYENWYKGHERRFHERRMDLQYNVDKFFELVKAGLSSSVYLDFPAYVERKFGVYLNPEPDVTLPSALKEIAAEAFMGIAAAHIRIPDGVEAIGAAAFADCPNLATITIPASVTTIADNAFNAQWLTIFGAEGSFAQSYAAEKGYTFAPMH